MTVRKNERKEGKLQVLNAARELKEYTLQMLRSDKRFPKSTRWLYAQPIANEIRNVCLAIVRANATYINEEYDYEYRRKEQNEAHAGTAVLLALIDDAYRAGYVSGKQVEHWTGLVIRTDMLIKQWRKSDRERWLTAQQNNNNNNKV